MVNRAQNIFSFVGIIRQLKHKKGAATQLPDAFASWFTADTDSAYTAHETDNVFESGLLLIHPKRKTPSVDIKRYRSHKVKKFLPKTAAVQRWRNKSMYLERTNVHHSLPSQK